MLRKASLSGKILFMTQSQNFSEAWYPYAEVAGLQQEGDLFCLHAQKVKGQESCHVARGGLIMKHVHFCD